MPPNQKGNRMTRRDRASRPKTETSDYVAMLTRMINAWGDRVADDPAALVHLGDLIAALRDATNRGMFEANRRPGGYSHNDMAAILGVTRPAIGKRIALGEGRNSIGAACTCLNSPLKWVRVR